MGIALLRQLLHRAPRAARRGRPRPRRPAVEELEARALPTTLAPLTGFSPALPPSTSAGGAAQALGSSSGRYTVYTSTAANVVGGQVDTAVASNVFLYDRGDPTRMIPPTTTLVSHIPGSDTTGGDGNSGNPRISSNGQFIAYESDAGDLVAGQAGPRGYTNVYLYNVITDATTLVSHRFGLATTSADDNSATALTTGFGFGPTTTTTTPTFLLFTSNANDLVANQQGPDVTNLFLYDPAHGTNTLVSHNADPAQLTGGDGDVTAADMTPDGSTVVYSSLATDVVSGQSGARGNVFRYNRATGVNQLVSGVYVAGSGNSPTAGAGSSSGPSVSNDGATIAYLSGATNLVAGQTTGGTPTRNVFAASAAGTTLVSGAGGSASMPGNADSTEAVVSSDGSTIAFLSGATNLVPGQGGNAGNAFVYKTSGGTLALASHVAGQSAAAGGVSLENTGTLDDLSVSSDGSRLAYLSTAPNLVAGPSGPAGVRNAFVYQAGQNALVSHAAGTPTAGGDQDTAFARLSNDGSTVALLSFATDLQPGVTVADGGQNLYVADPTAATDPVLASRSAMPATATTLVYGTSEDGRYVLFTSNAADVVPGQVDTNHDQDVFLLDRNTGAIALVSHTPAGPPTAGDRGSPAGVAGARSPDAPVLSADGNWVAFVSTAADLVAGDSGEATSRSPQVFLYDNRTGPTHGTVTLVSHDFASTSTVGAGDSDSPALSDDGRFLAFRSTAADLVGGFVPPAAGAGTSNVYLYLTFGGSTTLVSHAAGAALTSGDQGSSGPSISDDLNGTYRVAYQSLADDLVSGGTIAPVNNVYLFDTSTPNNALVSHVPGSQTTSASAGSSRPVISHDGNSVAFVSFAADLVSGLQPTPFTNVFLYRVAGGAVTLVSRRFDFDVTTASASSYSDSPALDTAGDVVAFRSDAPDVVTGQSNTACGSSGVFLFGCSNIFLFNPNTGGTQLLSHAADSSTTTAAGDSTAPAVDGAGDLIVYLSTANDVIFNQQGGRVNNVFVYSTEVGANGLASGQDGSPVVAGSTPAFLAVVSRDPVVAFNVLSGSRGASAPFLNTLARLAVSTNTVADGSPPGTVVGTLSVDSVFAGQVLLPRYSLPAVGDNGVFALGPVGGQASLLIEVPASYAARSSYQVTVVVAFGFGNDSATFVVLVSPGSAPPPTRDISARLISVKARKKKAQLMVEVFFVDNGAEKRRFLSPFQSPASKKIQVRVVNGNQIVVTARKGKKNVSATFSA
jgi:Tol biopolymer transport system component